ncbi:hypothetical protein ACFL42_04090 [Candidatus Omnitrophota bacterium]
MKIFAVLVSTLFIFASFCLLSYPAAMAQDTTPEYEEAPAPAEEAPAPAEDRTDNKEALRKGGFSVLFGVVQHVNMSDPYKPVIRIRSDLDGSEHYVHLSPWTNITKLTDASELKNGDAVRVMTKKRGDEKIAMTVVFGDIKHVANPAMMRRPPVKKPEPPEKPSEP